jgi:excinuclease UvrABC ATPase subunit
MEKPDVDAIEGLSPAIAIEQRSAGSNPRSTVATITEIYDYLRLLFARLGVQHCPKCDTKMERQSVDEIVDLLLERHAGAKASLLAPIVRGRKGEYRKELETASRQATCARAWTARGSSSTIRRSSRAPSATTSTSGWTVSRSTPPRGRGSPSRSRPRSSWARGW